MHADRKEPPREEERPASAPYEPPAIGWEEPWQPIAVGLSCSKQLGNPGCGNPFGA